MDIAADPRFIRGMTLFNEEEFLEASDCFEDLFFEGVRDEPDFIRIFLQFSVGAYHFQTGQRRPALERINEGLRLVAASTNDHGIDLVVLRRGMSEAASQIRNDVRPIWPRITST